MRIPLCSEIATSPERAGCRRGVSVGLLGAVGHMTDLLGENATLSGTQNVIIQFRNLLKIFVSQEAQTLDRYRNTASNGSYDLTTIWLHWTTVGLVAILWLIGQTADWIPSGPVRTGIWSIHVVLGLATAIVLLTRIVWRMHFGLALPRADTGVLYGIAKVTHYILYILLCAVILAGITDASYRGFSLFGVWPLPRFGTGDIAVRRSINEWHELAANLTIMVAALHAMAALVHHYVWRDHLLDRMKP